jgi:hypothetical protein
MARYGEVGEMEWRAKLSNRSRKAPEGRIFWDLSRKVKMQERNE